MSAPNHKLLIIDDEIEICNFVTAFFRDRGFDAYQANDGEEALRVAVKEQPHIILLDVMMKAQDDGFTLLPKLRVLLPKAKILMVTGVEDQTSALRGKNLGAEDYITKPLVLSYLEDTVVRKIKELDTQT